jgi:REP element-mobilizing transposase RayT
MPNGLVRYQQSGCFHFITFSCHHRLPYLGTQAARELFERSLEVMRIRYDFVVCGHVVMPEHVHLLISEPKKSILSKAIQALKLSGSLQSRELQGCTLVVGRYAGIAVFHGLIMALTFDPHKPLKTRGCGRGSKLTLCETRRGIGRYRRNGIFRLEISTERP